MPFRETAYLPLFQGAQNSFEEAKVRLATTALLIHPLPDAPARLVVDAPATTVGAVLQDKDGKDWRPLGFSSKHMKPTEARY